MVVWLEDSPGFPSTPLKNNDHKGSHEESGIGLLGVISASVVVDLVRAILLVVDQLLKLFAK